MGAIVMGIDVLSIFSRKGFLGMKPTLRSQPEFDPVLKR
jgi:hypothetical protein